MLLKIRRFFRNLIKWIPILKIDEQWDYTFLEEVILHKLRLMREFYDSGQSRTVVDDTVKELDITISALERLIENDYIHFPKGLAPRLQILEDEEESNLFSHLEEIYHEDFGEESIRDVYKKSEEDERNDRELVYKMLKDKSPSWWD